MKNTNPQPLQSGKCQTQPQTELSTVKKSKRTPTKSQTSQKEAGFGGEVHLTDALLKLDSLYGVVFKGKSYYLENRLEWLKASIEFALDDDEFRDDLVDYMKSHI